MAELPTGTVTFLFTDIQGSTPLWERASEKMAEAAAYLDQTAYSARLLGALERVRKYEKDGWKEITPEKVKRVSDLTRSRLGEEDFQAAWKEGRNMTLEQAVAYALEEHG
jgi:class 3 adenylate cyclase